MAFVYHGGGAPGFRRCTADDNFVI